MPLSKSVQVQIPIRDKPTLPRYGGQCVFLRSTPRYSYSRLCTINTAECTGITFFVLSGYTYAIHAHTKTTPSAQTTFEELWPRDQSSASWVYIPFTSDDPVTAFGFRRSKFDKRLQCSFLVNFCLYNTIFTLMTMKV